VLSRLTEGFSTADLKEGAGRGTSVGRSSVTALESKLAVRRRSGFGAKLPVLPAQRRGKCCPDLPFAIPVASAQLGGFRNSEPDDPWRKQHCTPLRRVDPPGRPHARATTRGMSFSISSSQRQSENSDSLLLVLPTAQAH
jgi:hypothetical protein